MNKKTICPEMWEYVSIFPDGDVFLCCLPFYVSEMERGKKKNSIGNINQKNLKEIWNGEKAIEIRGRSLCGNLECYNKCNIWGGRSFSNEEYKKIVPYENLKRIDISVSEACNIDCIMCYQDKNRCDCLSYDKLRENIDYSYFEDICLQGGEPFAIQGLKDFFDWLTLEKGKRVNFVTNGTLINIDWAERISKFSDYICFSVNAATKETHEKINRGSDWEKVLSNIKLIKNFKGNVIISGHMTIVIENLHEISRFIREYEQLGFDEIDFSVDMKVEKYLSENLEIKESLRKEIIGALRSQDRSKIDIDEIIHLGLTN